MRPLAPEIDARGGLDDFGNVRSANSGGDFEEVELAVGVGFQEFGVSDSANAAEALNHLAIGIEQRLHAPQNREAACAW